MYPQCHNTNRSTANPAVWRQEMKNSRSSSPFCSWPTRPTKSMSNFLGGNTCSTRPLLSGKQGGKQIKNELGFLRWALKLYRFTPTAYAVKLLTCVLPSCMNKSHVFCLSYSPSDWRIISAECWVTFTSPPNPFILMCSFSFTAETQWLYFLTSQTHMYPCCCFKSQVMCCILQYLADLLSFLCLKPFQCLSTEWSFSSQRFTRGDKCTE